jgi:hypothetical protein
MKKVIFIDDVFSATNQEVRRMLPKASCEIQKYQKKNEGDVELNEYSEIFLTSNQKAPLMMKPGSRRQLMLHASEIRLLQRTFFAKMKMSTRDLDIAKAWFNFFKTRDITAFCPQSNPDNQFRGEVVASCMSKSHQFLTRFFSEPEWYLSYRPDECGIENWLRAFEVFVPNKQPHKDVVIMRITQKRMYTLYKRFMRERNSCSKPRNSDTFWEELEELGVCRYSKVRRLGGMEGKQKMCVDLFYSPFLAKVNTLYKGLEISPWIHLDAQFQQNIEEIKKRFDYNFE